MVFLAQGSEGDAHERGREGKGKAKSLVNAAGKGKRGRVVGVGRIRGS